MSNYDPSTFNRDLITTVSNTFGTATISAFNYENDAFGRRTARTDTTPTLTVNNAFGYNLKSEVTSATMGENQYGYDYDPIGNRIYAAFNAATNTYSANALNQYAVITNSVPLCEIKTTYDYDGNMLTNGVWSYSWDAENRLTAVYSNNTLLVSNSYDHQSRRIVKNLHHEGTETQRRDFVYDSWNLLQELITDNGSLTTNSFTWGLDLSGSLQGAGGVGGLLAVNRDNAVYFPCFDANGNVTEYVNDAGLIVAHYSFDAFGNTISQPDDLASTFSHRFSTKYFDSETGLYYYGYRYYASILGIWLSRDPIGEAGGFNIYTMLFNSALDDRDYLGLYGEKDPSIEKDEWERILNGENPEDVIGRALNDLERQKLILLRRQREKEREEENERKRKQRIELWSRCLYLEFRKYWTTTEWSWLGPVTSSHYAKVTNGGNILPCKSFQTRLACQDTPECGDVAKAIEKKEEKLDIAVVGRVHFFGKLSRRQNLRKIEDTIYFSNFAPGIPFNTTPGGKGGGSWMPRYDWRSIFEEGTVVSGDLKVDLSVDATITKQYQFKVGDK